jgi:ABC-2 type transport system ATP-binding protein
VNGIKEDEFEAGTLRGMETAPAFECTALSKSFGRREILAGLSLRIEAGETVGLLGANGAGKTTLLKILLGLMPASAGSTAIAGERSRSLSKMARGRIAYVPQTPTQFAWLTGQSMLKYIAAFYPAFDWAYTRSLAERWKVSLKTPIGLLSPGQQQRLSILRALGPRPDFVVLDEPIAALDPATRMAVIEELTHEHRERGISVIFSSHITADLQRFCTRFIVLANETIALNETTEECRRLQRITVTGDEERLRELTFEHCKHVRKSRDGERVLVCSTDRVDALMAQLPPALAAAVDASEDLESIFSEWMQ